MTVLLPFQAKAVRRIGRFNLRSLIAHDMGLGKSLTSLTAASENGAWPAVVVCPASLKWNWEREAKIHLRLRAEVLEGRKPRAGSLTKRKLVIVNYDILGAWLPWLKGDVDPELVIVDESQLIANRNSKRTKWVRLLCQDVPCVLALSGTPLVNRPPELWPTVNLLWPKEFPGFWAFCQEFTVPRRTPWGWDFKRSRNLDVLHERLKRAGMLRKRKSQVLKDLPEKQREILLLPVDNRRDYDHAEDDFLAWLKKRDKTKVRKAKRAQRLVQMGWLKRLAAEGKMPSVLEWIENFLEGSDEKLVVMAVHKSVIKAIHDRWRKISVVVDGSVTGRKRQLAVDQFNKRKDTRLFIGNIKAAGVGLSITGASTMAVVELPWTPGACSQAEDRIHGISRGIEGIPTSIFYLVARNTIESKLIQLIQEKQDVLDQTLDGKIGAGGFDILDRLEAMMQKGALV